MPVLPEFSIAQGRQAANAAELRPSEEGIQALAQGARNISRLTQEQAAMSRQAGAEWDKAFREVDTGVGSLGKQLEDHQTLQEVSSMGPAISNIQLSMTSQFTGAISAAANGNYDKLNQFHHDLDETLSQFESNAVTPDARKHAIGMAETIRQHFTIAQLSELPHVAGEKVVNDLAHTGNALTAASIADPATFGANLAILTNQVNAVVAQHGNLTPEAQEKLKGQLLDTQIGGTFITTLNSIARGNPTKNIQPNPDGAQQFFDTYASKVSPAHQEQGMNIVREARTAQQVQSRLDDAQARRQETDEANRIVNNGIVATIDPTTGKTTVPGDAMAKFLNDYANSPGLQRNHGLAESYIKYLHSVANDPMGAHDDATHAQLFGHISPGDPQGTTLEQALRARADNKLTQQEFTDLSNYIQRRDAGDRENINKTFDTVASGIRLQPQFGLKDPYQTDPAGGLAYARWYADARPMYDALIRQGKTPADAAAYVMSPEYMANPKYQKTTSDQLSTTIPGAPKTEQEKDNIWNSIFKGFK